MNAMESSPVQAASTKDRILNAAEKLLATHGFEATSLRAITAEAGVNLAAVNYHFQTKEALFRAVIARRIDPVNKRRMTMLDVVEARAGEGPLPIGPVIEAFVRPAFEVRGCTATVAPIMGRIFAESANFLERFFNDHLTEVTQRFFPAFERAAPHLSKQEVLWRTHFLIGSMSHTMIAGQFFEKVSGGLCRAGDIDGLVRRMVAAYTAAFEAPSTENAEHEN
jgi:AcrR family transcriptional regulator